MCGLIHSIIAGAFTVLILIDDISNNRGYPQFCTEINPPCLLAEVLPMITVGYAVFDVIVGLRSNRVDYFLHGVILFGFMGVSCMYGMSHHLSYGLSMEWSTIFLNLRALKKNWIDIVFVVTFVATRIFLVPYLWWIWVKGYERADDATKACLAGSEILYHSVIFAGMFFNLLNLYWGQIIVRRLYAKIRSGNAVLCKEWKPEPGQNTANVNENPESFAKRD
mmetsp:Transcript_41381/g.81312  ORF Transcript_41381/g.81312 Transcript_41381/m.81312 type:complete len:222 (+) Transcript_41381:86-751(+)